MVSSTFVSFSLLGSLAPAPEQEVSSFSDVPDGKIGTLRIHKSGRVSLLIGNIEWAVEESTRIQGQSWYAGIRAPLDRSRSSRRKLPAFFPHKAKLSSWGKLKINW